jgi:hypothetical protein
MKRAKREFKRLAVIAFAENGSTVIGMRPRLIEWRKRRRVRTGRFRPPAQSGDRRGVDSGNAAFRRKL